MRCLNRLADDMSPAMLEISEYLHERTRDHFDDEQAPDGTSWATLNPETIKRKQAKGDPVDKTLHGQSLHLRDAIYPFHSTVEAGVSTGPGTAAYAIVHQFGNPNRNIQAREYLGLSSEDEREIVAILGGHLKAEMDGS